MCCSATGAYLSAGEVEDKSYALIKPGGTFAHILNTGTNDEKVQAGKKWTDKR